MKQASLLGWLKPEGEKQAKVQKLNKSNLTKRPAPRWVYRFLLDFPEGIMTPDGPAGPFRKGDLVSENVMPAEVWRVLMRRGVVQPFRIRPEWPGPSGRRWPE